MKRKLTILLILVIMALSTTVCFATTREEFDEKYGVLELPDETQQEVALINQESAVKVAKTNQGTAIIVATIAGASYIIGSFIKRK